MKNRAKFEELFCDSNKDLKSKYVIYWFGNQIFYLDGKFSRYNDRDVGGVIDINEEVDIRGELGVYELTPIKW